jgi:hypothetical protein
MLLARLRTFAPRLACRAVSSNPPPPKGRYQAPQQTGSPPPRTTRDFIDLLAEPPRSQGGDDLFAGAGGQSALRNHQLDDDAYTSPLRPGSTNQIYRLYVKSTNNNTLITLTDPHGNALKGGSAYGGTMGFKGVAKSGTFALAP